MLKNHCSWFIAQVDQQKFALKMDLYSLLYTHTIDLEKLFLGMVCQYYNLNLTIVSQNNPKRIWGTSAKHEFVESWQQYSSGTLLCYWNLCFLTSTSVTCPAPCSLNMAMLMTRPSSFLTSSCDRNARAANAQSFTLWRQATIEITCHDHPYCLFAPHIYGCYSSHTSRSWWIAHSTQRHRRGCNKVLKWGGRSPFFQRIADYLSAWRLRLSAAKTTCTAFHLNNKESSRKLAVTVNGTTIPYTWNPTYLGVTLGHQVTFRQLFEGL